jgi:N-acyl-D-amino-acid deacylase
MNDFNIRNATIIDGSGGPAREADLGIKDGRIAEIGQVGAADTELDAAGTCLAPGLIDTHAHDDGAFLKHPDMTFKLSQGVTTVVNGNCGFSAIPLDYNGDGIKGSGGILAGIESGFTDLEGYFRAVLAKKPSINNMMLVGHNTIRSLVMGSQRNPPSSKELSAMGDHVDKAMEQGACGFSTGLIYRPGRYSETEEIIELARVAQPYGGLYTTHMRNEGDRLLEAIDEALRIGKEANVHAHISHHKAAGKQNWGKVKPSLDKINSALAKGQRISLDVYPYTAGSGRMIEYFNLDNINRELAEVIRLASCPAFREYEGRMLKDIATEKSMDIVQLVHEILTSPKGDRTICIQFIIDETDIETNLRWQDMMVGSDGIPDLNGRPHPRLFGTFPRILGHYVRDKQLISLTDAVRRMTSLAASTFGIEQRGLIKQGYWADLVLFNPDTIADAATYDEPKKLATGIDAVFVNGKLAFQNGQYTQSGSGEMLRYKRDSFKV